MQIIFQTPTGDKYSAELHNSLLTDIQLMDKDSTAPSEGGGGTPSGGEPKPQEQPQEQSPQEGSGASNPPSAEDRVFIEQLKAVLVNNRARKQLRHKQKGLLDTRALVKTQTDSTSVFRQNNRKDSMRNYSVVLLVDESGSMSGPKAELAQDLTLNISKSLEAVGGVEVAVLGFSGNRIIEHKRFDSSGHSSLGCISNLVGRDRPHCSTCEAIRNVKYSDHENADLIAMEFALGYLSKNHATNSKPVFIMLSDGRPCNSPTQIAVVTADLRSQYFNSKFIKDDTRTDDITPMHQLLRLFPDVNAFGLGMQRGGQQVPKHKVVNDITQTKRVLLDFLRTAIQ